MAAPGPRGGAGTPPARVRACVRACSQVVFVRLHYCNQLILLFSNIKRLNHINVPQQPSLVQLIVNQEPL